MLFAVLDHYRRGTVAGRSEEFWPTFPDEVVEFLQEHAPTMPAPAIRRATERLPPEQRKRARDALC